MKLHRIFFSILLFANARAFGQTPLITDVLDAGSYMPGLAQGSVFVVKGSNLCATSAQSPVPYGTGPLGGASIQFIPGTGGTPFPALMIYASCAPGANQLAGVVPATLPTGNYTMTVTNNGAVSPQFATTVVTTKFEIMTLASNGKGRALAQNVVSQTQYDLNGFTTGPVSGQAFQRSPAYPGEVLVIWGTGLGGVKGTDSAPPAAGYDFRSQGLNVYVFVGGVPVTPLYAGLSNLFPGLDNIAFQLPPNVPTGCDVSLQVQAGGNGVGPGSGGQFSNITTIAIAPAAGGGACVSPQFSTAALARMDQGGTATIGEFWLQGSPQQGTAAGGFSRINADQLGVASLLYAPPGTCRVGPTTENLPEFARGTGSLDAGAITLKGLGIGTGGSQILTKGADNVYSASVTPFPTITPQPYTISGAGGADVGPFSASAVLDAPITITSGVPAPYGSVTAVLLRRDQDLTITWTGGGTDWVQVIGSSSAPVATTTPTLDTEIFACTTTADKGTITVPAAVLSRLPVSPTNPNSANQLFVISRSPASATNGVFTAPLTAGGTTDTAIFYAAMVAGGGAAIYQ